MSAMNTTIAPRMRIWRWVGLGVGMIAIIALALVGVMFWRMNSIPADLDRSTTRTSAQGAFVATISPAAEPVPINTLHRWTLHLETPDGRPIENATVTVDGDMPQHGHGMPTQPQVTEYLGNGDYLIEGMKFQMNGWWVVDFTIDNAGERDTVRFNLVL